MLLLLLLLLEVMQIGENDAVELIRREDDRIQKGRLLDQLVHDEVRRRRQCRRSGGGGGGRRGGRGGGVDENGGGI